MASLSDRLRSLGVRIGVRDLPSARERNPYSIERVVPGRRQPTPYGDTYVVETRHPAEMRHGTGSLRPAASLDVLAEWADDPRLARIALGDVAFVDTETTGLARGPGTYAFMVGAGHFDGDSFCLLQFFMRDPAEEPALLHALTAYLAAHEALITFNGRGFDVPLLDARYITNGELSPLDALCHLDLLPLARRLWRERLASRALGSLETHILGVRRTEEDIPGWMIPSLYFDYLRTRDARPLQHVFYHNAMDVLSMAALLRHISSLIRDPTSGDVNGLDLIGVAHMYEYAGDLEKAVQLYERGLACRLPEDVHGRTLHRLSFIYKRHGNLTAAAKLWREAAEEGQLYAHVELAKFYEHRAHDYAEAARWAEQALALVHSGRCHRLRAERWLVELEHRLARLSRKRCRAQRAPASDGSADQPHSGT